MIMQNKANFSKPKMSASLCGKKDYIKKTVQMALQKQTQSKPNKAIFPGADGVFLNGSCLLILCLYNNPPINKKSKLMVFQENLGIWQKDQKQTPLETNGFLTGQTR
jgi:hypothetical protein